MRLGEKRQILERLAEGELSLEEAETLLDKREVEVGVDPRPRDVDTDVDIVPVIAHLSGGGLIEVIGEADLDTPVADGPCNISVRRRGDAIRVHASGASEDYAVYVPAAAPLDVQINAADGEITGLAAPFSVVLNVGDARVEAAITRGASTIVANCGDLSICLDPASDVRVLVQASTDVDADPVFERVGRGEWRLGAGTATLTVRGNLGVTELTTA